MPVQRPDIDENLVCQLYQEGVHNSTPVLAKRFKCSPTYLIKILRKHGVEVRTNSSSQIGQRLGKKSPRYKGGCVAMGYRRVQRNRRTVLEHRLVMEEHLGRPLRDDEVVHHINGNKLDNRVENLEILSRQEHHRRHWVFQGGTA